MDWKYFQPHPLWGGSRSFIIKEAGDIVAHGGVVPVSFLVADIQVSSLHLIDWCAKRTVPGSGTLLVRHLARLSQTLMTVGGSAITRQILPKLGYRTHGEVEIYARVVRPWRQFRDNPRGGWKAPLRLLRNTAWSLSSTVVIKSGWSFHPVPVFDDSLLPLFASRRGRSFVSTHRSPAMLNYFLRCPTIKFFAYLILNEGAVRGWFMLANVAGQARIADIWVNSESGEEWSAAFSLATCVAAEHCETCEVTAGASIPLASEALLANGYRLRHCEPIFLYDPKDLVTQGRRLNLSLIDGDGAFRRIGDYPYFT